MNAVSPRIPATVRTFTQLLSSSRRGARLGRLLAAEQLRAWEMSPDVTERAVQIAAELCANAALHGRVRNRDFRLTLAHDITAGLLRVARHRCPRRAFPSPADGHGTAPPDAESGRGLLLVTALADRWGVEPYPPGGKTVWAECACAEAGSGFATEAVAVLGSGSGDGAALHGGRFSVLTPPGHVAR